MAMRVRPIRMTVACVRALVATASLLALLTVSASGVRAAVPSAARTPVPVAAAEGAGTVMGDAQDAGGAGHAGHTMAPAAASAAETGGHQGHGTTSDATQAPAEHVHPVPPPTTGRFGQPGQSGQPGPAEQAGGGDPASQAQLAGVDERLGDIIPEGILLRDEAGNPIDPRTLMDVPVIIAPIYYSCPTVCNMLQSSLARVLPQVSLQPGKEYRVLSVSFDETDTPQLAARKKQNYFAAMNFAYPEDGWRFLSGDLASINKFMDAIGFRFTRQGRDFIHPVALIVTAPGGKVVRYLYGQNFLPFDLTMAVTEASHGTIGLSVKRVLSYCFTYDPEGRRYVFDFMRIAGIIILFGAAVLLFVLVWGGPRRKERKGPPGTPPTDTPPSGTPPSGTPPPGTPPG
jgi:protein SCO1/2